MGKYVQGIKKPSGQDSFLMGGIFYELKEERGGFMKRIYKVYKKTVSILNETPTAM